MGRGRRARQLCGLARHPVTDLRDLALAAGLAPEWRDAGGQARTVSHDALAALLGALGHAADTETDRRRSLAQIADREAIAPPLLSGDVGRPIRLPPAMADATQAELAIEDTPPRALQPVDGWLPAVETIGYHRLRIDGEERTLAIAPRTCFPLPDRRIWGAAVQIPSLRDHRARPYGDFGALTHAARLLGERGADALAISPVHALYPGDGRRFSPYAPSSRLFRNAALADPELAGLSGLAQEDGGDLIDWAAAVPPRLAALRAAFASVDAALRASVNQWVEDQGEALRLHALHDALHLHFAQTAKGWRDWPAEYHDPHGDAVQRFAAQNRGEIAFHLFAQYLAAQNLEAAQAAAKESGMAVGLIADLAVGVDPGGSDAWAMQGLMLEDVRIGAPPDLLGPDGQNWNLTGFSPEGLVASGFAPWIATLRATMAYAGGIRIDHAFGLRRLWITPEGASAIDGAYLAYPQDELMRLIAIESHRASAIVIAEDLGTHPPGFAKDMAERGMAGMRVLWFEREGDGAFRSPAAFDPVSVAMTATHDAPTVSGWWGGRDLDWNARLGRSGPSEADRDRDRAALWSAIGAGAPQPPSDHAPPVVDAAIRHVAGAASRIAIAPLEDLAGEAEQPNLPGTIDEHPNWRRRLARPTDELLDDPAVAARIAALKEARPR